jgi:CDP-glucose 4,6-dehydratase
VENLVNPAFWKGRRVLVTGHTGFKGSWLSLWLRELGAEVSGYSLDPPTDPNLFTLARLAPDGPDFRGDVYNRVKLGKAFADSRPEVVFHLAAQPLVRASYLDPRETWRVIVSGTVEVLEACRAAESVRAVVVVTTDKVYENPERGRPFGEDSPLGGHDPYSGSKAACEILCASWRRSFFAPGTGMRKGLATARAGNVIGGGDFAADRLIPDLVRAAASKQPARLRYPDAVRPWQHVLEPLAGYLLLAERVHGNPADFSEAFNFGPDDADARTVGEVADAACRFLGASWERESAPQPHEAGLLRLDSSKAGAKLGWMPRLGLDRALDLACGWYTGWKRGEDARAMTLAQIRAYQAGIPG